MQRKRRKQILLPHLLKQRKKQIPPTPATPHKKRRQREKKRLTAIASKPYINSDSAYPVGIQESATTEPVPVPVESGEQPTEPYERILPPPVPVTPTGIASVWAEAGVKVAPTVATSEWAKTPVATPVETAPTTQEKPTIKALPVEEAEAKTEEVKKIITEEGKKLWITINGLEISESPLGQEIVDMILYYEWPGGSRQPDVGGYDIWGGINTGSSVEEKKYALGENYAAWNGDFIPKENVRECVLRLLNVRIALTKKSCTDKWIDFDSLPQNVKGVLVDLHYNMPSNINEFTKFWAAIKDKNWQEAGKQLVDNGSGSPSGYLSQVAGRACANALMLANGDTNYAEYKQEAEKISGGANLLNHYNQKVGEYGKKVGMWERKEIVKNAENAGDILAQTTSTDVLSTNWSTKSVTKILDKYIQEHPEERTALITGLVEKIWNFSRPLQTPEEVGAFQQLVYLANPEAFKQLEYIDGENGPKTEAAFVKEAFTIGRWQEKIEWASGILSKSPEEISAYIAGLNDFEKWLLKRYYTASAMNENSSPADIKKTQLGLALSGENIPVDWVWNDKMRELLEYPELAKSLGSFVENNYGSYGWGAFSCGGSVGRMLNAFGVKGLPSGERHGKNWNEFLDARPSQFTKVKINTPDEALPGGILCYDEGGGGKRSKMARRFWHVEVKGDNGKYYHYEEKDKWWGSAGPNLKNSVFTGYVYYPRKLEA
jgi:hypothetical protein